MRGKEKCKALKEIRRKIAEENDIAYAVSECTYQGECKGTCPKCEAELRYLERELELRKNLGKAVVVAGISAGICAPMVACNPIDAIGNVIEDVYYTINPSAAPIAGDMEYIPPEQLTGEEYIPEDDYQGMEGTNPDAIEPSEEDSEEVIMGDFEYVPEFEESSDFEDLSEEDIDEEDAQIIEGAITVDPDWEEDSDEE